LKRNSGYNKRLSLRVKILVVVMVPVRRTVVGMEAIAAAAVPAANTEAFTRNEYFGQAGF